MRPCIVSIIVNDDQQDATILAYLFIPNQLYMFSGDVFAQKHVQLIRNKQVSQNSCILLVVIYSCNIVHCELENVLVTTLPGYLFSFNLQIHFCPYVISYFISKALSTVLFVNITEELEFYMEVYCRCHYMT